jgi:fructose-specific component phosphotransferase system IIB-like protein
LLRGFEKEHNGTVSHSCFLTNSREYTGKKVVVVGAGASALETCQRLYHIGANVTQCTREVPSEVVPPSSWIGGAAPKPASASAVAERILSLWGTDSKRAEKFIRTLMATRMHDGVDVPKVGILRRVEGRDLYFAAASKPKMSISDHLDEMELAGVRGTSPKADDGDDVGEVVTDVDAVFFATGYQYRMPFLPDHMRSVLEPAAVRRLTAGGKHRDIGQEEGALAQRYTDDRGLLLGCIWKDVPTIAFVGRPSPTLWRRFSLEGGVLATRPCGPSMRPCRLRILWSGASLTTAA